MKLWNFFLVIVWNYHNKVNKAGSFPRTACWHLGDVKSLMLISFQFKGPKFYLCKQYGDFIQKWISLQNQNKIFGPVPIDKEGEKEKLKKKKKSQVLLAIKISYILKQYIKYKFNCFELEKQGG